jgi:extracellular matrix protein 14
MSTAGLQIDCGGKIDSRHPCHSVLESIQIDHGDTCGTLPARKFSPRILVRKVLLLVKHTDLGYRGEKPFAAPESKHMADYIHKTLPSRHVVPIGYVDFHSYSQEILYPFAFDCDVLPADAEDLAELAWGAAKAARNVHGRYFDVDSACESDNFNSHSNTKIINGGAAVDWAYAKGKIRYSYSVKLRDTGNHGFLLPRGEIIPSGEEMFAMAKQLAEFILDKP